MRSGNDPPASPTGKTRLFAVWPNCNRRRKAFIERPHPALAGERKLEFALERAVFLTVLHRLLGSSFDRAADRRQQDYRIDRVERLASRQFYRTMVRLGKELPAKD